MSFVGTNSFGNYDRTAQTRGLPAQGHQATNEEALTNPAATTGAVVPAVASEGSGSNEATRTRTTSVTDIGAESPSRRVGDKVFDDDDLGDESEEERRNGVVQALARRYTTNQSHASAVVAGQNPFLLAGSDEDSPINPNSSSFRARAWAKAMVDMVSREGQSFRTSGIAFQNLNVFGYGAHTDYQKDVGNVWLSALGMLRRVLGGGRRRIDILRNFDGVVKKGEMLVVLGPPGSGCSTLLKTIAGETNGIYIDDSSYFNYQGMLPSYTCRILAEYGIFELEAAVLTSAIQA